MQLNLRRTQRAGGGLLSKSVTYVLEARIELTSEEKVLITSHQLDKQVVVNTDAVLKHLQSAAMGAVAGNVIGGLKNLKSVANAINLEVTLQSLEAGQQIECKSLGELVGMEAAICSACNRLYAYMNTVVALGGAETVINFGGYHADQVPTLEL